MSVPASQPAGSRRGGGGVSAGEEEGEVGGEVAELRLGRDLEADRRGRRDAERARGDRVAQRLAEKALKVTLHPGPRGAKDGRRGARPGTGAWSCDRLYAPGPAWSSDLPRSSVRAHPAAARRRGTAFSAPLPRSRRRGFFL